MKKVGIVTFHRAKNCGAVLQCFALYCYLSSFASVDVIDYRCSAIENAYYKVSLKGFLKKISRPYSCLKTLVSDYKFRKFRSKLPLTDKIRKNSNTNNLFFDVIITGSDQVFNTKLTNYDYYYYLNAFKDITKISYAASFGNNVSEIVDDKVLKYLNDFKQISIREIDDSNYLSSRIKNIAVTANCDPVFLLNCKEWNQTLNLKAKKSEYILVYLMQKSKEAIDFAIQLSKKENCRIILLDPTHSLKKKGIKIINSFGPIDFLNFIQNAKHVITTSFHGLAFSIIFNKSVFFELSKESNNRNKRLVNLINIFNLQNRNIDFLNVNNISSIDYNPINKIILEYSKKGKEMLREAIERDERS